MHVFRLRKKPENQRHRGIVKSTQKRLGWNRTSDWAVHVHVLIWCILILFLKKYLTFFYFVEVETTLSRCFNSFKLNYFTRKLGTSSIAMYYTGLTLIILEDIS